MVLKCVLCWRSLRQLPVCTYIEAPLSARYPSIRRRRLAVFPERVRQTAVHQCRQQKNTLALGDSQLWWIHLQEAWAYCKCPYSKFKVPQSKQNVTKCPRSEALQCLRAKPTTVSMSNVVVVVSTSIIQSDNAPSEGHVEDTTDHISMSFPDLWEFSHWWAWALYIPSDDWLVGCRAWFQAVMVRRNPYVHLLRRTDLSSIRMGFISLKGGLFRCSKNENVLVHIASNSVWLFV